MPVGCTSILLTPAAVLEARGFLASPPGAGAESAWVRPAAGRTNCQGVQTSRVSLPRVMGVTQE
jgi:hypothetical protein